MYAIGKIGCSFAGCCYGIEYSGFGSIIYRNSLVAPNNVSCFPVQIAETIVFLVIYIYMMKKMIKNEFTVYILGKSIIICGTAKFLLDYLRISHVEIIFSINQKISLIFIIIGMCICLNTQKGGMLWKKKSL